MNRRTFLATLTTCLILVYQPRITPAQEAPGRPEGDPERIERQLQRLQGRFSSSGGVILPRYRQSLTRLENNLNSDDCRRFNHFVERDIVALWGRIDREWISQMVSTPPTNLGLNQKVKIQQHDLMVKRLYANLRRVRRLQTRLDKLSRDTKRIGAEVNQRLRQYRHLVDELERIDRRRAIPWREWLEGSAIPPLQGLESRSRIAGEKVERLRNWTESGEIRNSLGELRRVSEAIELLKRRYSLSHSNKGK